MHSVTIHVDSKFVIDCWADGTVDVRGWSNANLMALNRLQKVDPARDHWAAFVDKFGKGPVYYHPFTGRQITVEMFPDAIRPDGVVAA